MAAKREVVTVSSRWNSPQITTTVTNQEIALQMSMADFVIALKQELGLPGKLLSSKIDEAVNTIIKGIKAESKKVMV